MVVIALVVLWYLTPNPRGRFMAHIDHARGHFEVIIIGGSSGKSMGRTSSRNAEGWCGQSDPAATVATNPLPLRGKHGPRKVTSS
jgi:hypothetical protein